MDAATGIEDDPAPLVRALIGLTVVTGLVDAISFLGLGHVFTANMTGNIVFLGFAAAGAPGISAARSIGALCAFAGGSVCGGRLTASRQRTRVAHMLIATYLETALLLVAAGAATFARTDVPAAEYLIVLFTALAMGLRNAVVRKLAVPDLTTTVLTMTITGLAADSSLARGQGGNSARRALSILAMFAGALVGAMLLRTFGLTASLVVAALMVAVPSLHLRSHARPKLGT